MADFTNTAAEKTLIFDRSSWTIRRLLVLLLKMTIAAALIYWLLKSNRLDFRAFRRVESTPYAGGVILLAVLGVFLGQLLLALRLLWLLKTVKIETSYARVLGITLVGSFFGCALPGLVGGDVVKAVYLCSDAVGKRANAMGTVIADRALGFYSLFLLGAMAWAAALCTGTIALQNRVFWMAPAAAICMTVGFVLIGLPGYKKWPVAEVVWNRIPTKAQNLLQTLHICLSRPGLLAITVLLSLLNHALVIATYLAAAVLLGDTLPWSMHFVLSPLAMVLNMVALTPGGIGLTEGAFSFLYEGAGSPNGACVGLMGRLFQYLSFAITGLIALFQVRIRDRRSNLAYP